jgi:hypothetical protein
MTSTLLPCGYELLRARAIGRIFTVTSCAERQRTVSAPAHPDGMTDEQPEDPRVFDRMLAAGLSIERIEQHLAAGRVRLDGELVTDPYTPAPSGTLIVLMTD